MRSQQKRFHRENLYIAERMQRKPLLAKTALQNWLSEQESVRFHLQRLRRTEKIININHQNSKKQFIIQKSQFKIAKQSFKIQPSKFKIHKTMAKKVNAKREAYQKKQEKQGKNIVMWIIGGLIALGLLFAIWTSLG
jgi:hypothetical protein